MKTLATLPHLKCLGVTLRDCRRGYYGPTGLAHLARLQSLEELTIVSNEPLPDADLSSLESLTYLKDLHIFGSGVSDQVLSALGKLKQLERLQLNTATRSGLNHLNGLSNLQYLNVGPAWGNARKTSAADEVTLDLSGLKHLKDLSLGWQPLQDSDLAFLEHLPLLDRLLIDLETNSLTGASLRHLRGLSKLDWLWIRGLSTCTGQDLASLSNLQNLREVRIAGDITDAALESLMGPPRLNSLTIETGSPIRKETVTDLTKSHPGIEYIHINTLPRIQTKPVGPLKRPGVSQPRR